MTRRRGASHRPQPEAAPRPLTTQADINAAEDRGRRRMAAAAKAEAERNAAPGYRRMAADLQEAIRAIATADAEATRREDRDADWS